MAEFRMPSLGADMVAGTLVEWRIAPGDVVKRGDVVAEVETDKGAIEVEIFENGVVDRLLVEPGTKVPVDTPLAVIRTTAGGTAGARQEKKAEAAVTEVARTEARRPAGRLRVSPLARRMAQELGVDLAMLSGSGAEGTIVAADVEAAARAEGPSPRGAAPMRRAIAAAMSRSKREIPHYYLTKEIEVGTLVEWLEDRNARVPVAERLLAVAPLLKAVALALKAQPGFNGYCRDGAFLPMAEIHLGLAIRLRQGGLVAPAIHRADRLSLAELMGAIHDLIRRARAGSMRSSELADPTVTVTSLGDQGVDSVLGIVFPPQVAIIGLGRIRERPWADQGMLGVRPVMTATLAADHRVSDGYEGARLLNEFERLLRHPEAL